MPHLGSQGRHYFFVMLCIIATLWNIPDRLLAAQASEIHRPPEARGDASLSIDEVSRGMNDDERTYILTFKNLSDQEVVYTQPAFRFPGLNEHPKVRTAAEAAQYRDGRQTLNQSPSSSSIVWFPRYSHTPSSCEDTCIVIITVLAVIFIFFIVASVIAESNQNARIEKEAALNYIPYLENSIRLKPFEEQRRRIILQKNRNQGIEDIVIEFIDGDAMMRTFQVDMGAKASS